MINQMSAEPIPIMLPPSNIINKLAKTNPTIPNTIVAIPLDIPISANVRKARADKTNPVLPNISGAVGDNEKEVSPKNAPSLVTCVI